MDIYTYFNKYYFFVRKKFKLIFHIFFFPVTKFCYTYESKVDTFRCTALACTNSCFSLFAFVPLLTRIELVKAGWKISNVLRHVHSNPPHELTIYCVETAKAIGTRAPIDITRIIYISIYSPISRLESILISHIIFYSIS